ncbi:Ly6/PLAUR domain-containing protein 2 [Tupaia chinensis]|uniref:Ly6/PLAUR domain-containing protein 2 n=1 Tax=Tupaia chinensis TaxID=246437 RepID=L9JCP1_TUPCH|nr:Ly6/PLAUR domain-containing protein 2 [Tupaia chinensis]
MAVRTRKGILGLVVPASALGRPRVRRPEQWDCVGLLPVLLALLKAACGELTVALQGYTCQKPRSVGSCVTVTTCNANKTMCKIALCSLGAVYVFLRDSTGIQLCVSKHERAHLDSTRQTCPVSCCDTEQCNMNQTLTPGSPCSPVQPGPRPRP